MTFDKLLDIVKMFLEKYLIPTVIIGWLVFLILNLKEVIELDKQINVTKEMLESYFPKKELYGTDIPYLQQIFDQ